MIKNLCSDKNKGILSSMKYKKVYLISLNKAIVIPTFNSLTKCSTLTNRNSSSFSRKIPTIIKNKFIPKITKFNDPKNIIPSMKTNTDIHSRNSKIINLKSFQNKINNNNYNKNFSSLKIFQNNKKNVSKNNNHNIETINEKFLSLFTPYRFNNLSFNLKKKNLNLNRNTKLKINPIKLSDKSFNGKNFKSIFNKRNNNIKLDIFNEIKNELNLKKDVIKKDNIKLLENKEITKKNENKNLISNNIKKSKNKDKFLKFIIKNHNNKFKTKNIDLMKKNIIKKCERKIKHSMKETINNKKFKVKRINNNIYEIQKSSIKKNSNIIEEESIKKEMEIRIINIKKIVSNINTKDIINEYLEITYKTKELIFNYIKSFNLNKSNYITINYNLIEMKLLHINVEYEIDSTQKITKFNQNKLIKTPNRIISFDFCRINHLKNSKNSKNSKIRSNKYWKKYSLLKNASFFKKKNKLNYSKIYYGRQNSFFMNKLLLKINQNNKIITKNLIKKNDFEKLKYLIHDKKENQFEFEFLRIINNSDINTCDKDGNTLLILACMNGNLEIVKYLLENGANPNCVNLRKNTALHYAIANHEYDIADLLIQYGAKDNIENIDGLTPWQIYFLFI